MNRRIFLYLLLGIGLYVFIVVFKVVSAYAVAGKRVDKKIVVKAGYKTLYIQTSYWGLLGDHQRIYLSTDSNTITDNDKSVYTFYTTNLFYKYDRDTFKVYVLEAFIEPLKPFQTNVKVIKLKDYNDVLRLKRTHSETGLKHVSLYD